MSQRPYFTRTSLSEKLLRSEVVDPDHLELLDAATGLQDLLDTVPEPSASKYSAFNLEPPDGAGAITPRRFFHGAQKAVEVGERGEAWSLVEQGERNRRAELVDARERCEGPQKGRRRGRVGDGTSQDVEEQLGRERREACWAVLISVHFGESRRCLYALGERSAQQLQQAKVEAAVLPREISSRVATRFELPRL